MFNSSKLISKKIVVDNVPPRVNVVELFTRLDDIHYKKDNIDFQNWLNTEYYDNPDSYCMFHMDEDYGNEYDCYNDDRFDNDEEELIFYKKDIISNMCKDIIEILTINGNTINKTKGFKTKVANIIYNNSYKH